MKFLAMKKMSTLLLSALLLVFLYSCQKENSANTSDNLTAEEAVTYSDEGMAAEASFDDVNDLALSAADEETNAREGNSNGRLWLFAELRLRIGQCAEITVTPDDSTYPKTVVIDFGDGCLGLDGKFRRGALVLNFSAPIRQAGAVVSLTFRDFYLNRAHLEGTITYKNQKENGVHKYSITVENGAFTLPNGRGFKFEGARVVTQVSGMDTRSIRDDVYKIEGRSKTLYNNGREVVLTTIDPLIKKINCPWISEGTLKIRINDRVFKLDYGFPNNGDCDDKALLLWNNDLDQKVITLP
ncbi:MAG: hypothetical protein J0M30_09655 [Chitinophagales bacterium]|nr:hypothetical protein [Chitinophagales bacterium]